MDESEEMRILRALDEGTEWEHEGNLLSRNDPEDDDDGMAGVLAFPPLRPIDGGAEAEDSLERGPTVPEMLDTVRDMKANGQMEDLLILINTKDGKQHLMTTLDRNDHIIGMLMVATMNWHSSQIAASNYYDEEEEV